METYYIIGKRSPTNATKESEITHYKVAFSFKNAKAGIGPTMTKQDFINLVKPEDEIFAYDRRSNKLWKLQINLKSNLNE